MRRRGRDSEQRLRRRVWELVELIERRAGEPRPDWQALVKPARDLARTIERLTEDRAA